MTSNARAGRRRRLLHDGAAGGGAATRPDTAAEASLTRYAPKAGSASFAVASRVLPHSWGAITGAALLLLGTVAGAAGLTLSVQTWQGPPIEFLQVGSLGSLTQWWTTTLWLGVAAVAAVVFGLRRARMDDLRCGYRWWAFGVFVSVTMSFFSATNADAYFASYLTEWTGFSPLPSNAFWWLLPGVLLLAPLAIRLILDASESMAAVVLGSLALLILSAGWLSDAGLAPMAARELSPLMSAEAFGPLAALLGISIALSSMFCLARRIVRDSEGAIVPAASRVEKQPVKTESKTRARATKKPASEPRAEKPTEPAKAAPRAKSKVAEPKVAEPKVAEPKVAEPTAWVGGGDDYQEEYDDQPQRRRLSKAERKRLRKQKARRAA